MAEQKVDVQAEARAALLRRAQRWEEEGQVYQALTVYTRLASSPDMTHRVLPRQV